MTAGDATAAGVSVVVPAYGVADRVTRQLDALAPQVVACGGEMVVVDDGSPDDTGGVAAAWAVDHPSVRCTVVRAPVRRGVNASRNAGVHFATADVLAFTDGDDEVRPGWLAALTAAAVGGAIAAGHFAWPGSSVTAPAPPFFGVDRPTAMGGAMAMRRAVVDDVGGFDEVILRGGTETEFVLRAGLAHGVAVVAVPQAVVDYHLPADPGGRRRREFAMQRGFAVTARRVRSIPGAPNATFTVRSRLRDALGSAARVLTGGGDGRAESWRRVLADLVGVAWIIRTARRCPPRRVTDPATIAACYTVLAGPASNAVPGG